MKKFYKTPPIRGAFLNLHRFWGLIQQFIFSLADSVTVRVASVVATVVFAHKSKNANRQDWYIFPCILYSLPACFLSFIYFFHSFIYFPCIFYFICFPSLLSYSKYFFIYQFLFNLLIFLNIFYSICFPLLSLTFLILSIFLLFFFSWFK